jgi:hypothetical protein
VVHAPPNAIFGSKNEGKGSYTITRAEARADVILRLSFEDVFICRSGMLMDFLSHEKINSICGRRKAISDIEEATRGLMKDNIYRSSGFKKFYSSKIIRSFVQIQTRT